MKKLALLIVVSLFYVSNLTAQKNNPYDYVGQEHNRGLDFIYQKLVEAEKANKGKKLKFTKKDFKSFVINSTIEFVSMNNRGQKQEIEKVLKNDIIIFPFPPPLSPTFPNIPVEYKNKVPKQLEFTLKDIFNTAKKGNEKNIISLVDKIKKGKLSKEDKKIALLVASVAYHSIKYWKNSKNFNKWKRQNKKYNIWGLLGSDAGGAVGGAIAGSIIPGAGTAAGAIAGGITGSTSYAGAWLFEAIAN